MVAAPVFRPGGCAIKARILGINTSTRYSKRWSSELDMLPDVGILATRAAWASSGRVGLLLRGYQTMGFDDAGKTTNPLAVEVAALRQRVAELESANVVRNGAEQDLRKLEHDLRERVKELNCLLSISKLRDRPGKTIRTTLQGIVDLIPPAWLYPEVTCARVVLTDLECRTENFRETQWKLAREIALDGESLGVLEVYYLVEKPKSDHGPFLTEEKNLLDAIGERLERIIEHDRAEQTAHKQQQQMIQLDKMVALGTLVSGVAHEINNPNNFVMLNAPVLREAYESIMPILEEYYEENGDFVMGGLQYTDMRKNIPTLFAGILEGARRINSIVQSLKGFVRIETSGFRQPADMNSVIQSALVLVGNQIERSTKHFSLELAESLPAVKGNAQRLEQVIINLIQNACEALPDAEGAIVVSTSSDGRSVVVEVRDNGCGIPPEELPHIMDPFYTSKRNSGGTGLGLSVSLGIVKDHQGTLDFASTPGEGTTASLTFPVWTGEAGGGDTDK